MVATPHRRPHLARHRSAHAAGPNRSAVGSSALADRRRGNTEATGATGSLKRPGEEIERVIGRSAASKAVVVTPSPVELLVEHG
jgi:hypothetical protein